jgi:hypothetical protein
MWLETSRTERTNEPSSRTRSISVHLPQIPIRFDRVRSRSTDFSLGVKAFPDTSTYQLDVPNAPANFCFTFHASQLKRYVENDREHFLGQELTRDGPIVLAMADGSEEHVIDRTPTGSRPAEASARPW